MTAAGIRFDLAPAKAVEFFRGKGLNPSFAWQDMLHDEHDRAFTVAKMMDLDLLADVRQTVDRALSEGWTQRRFIDELKPELARRGWWGRAEMRDPATGEVRDVQLGSVRRLKTIYDANMRTAYSAGHWERIKENEKNAPYVMYSAVLDGRTRQLHREWNGKVLRADDPWWKTHTPPNGWNCRCTVIQLSQRDLEKLGKSGPDKAPHSPTREWTNPRTGEVTQLPAGVDPGWGYAPGASRRAEALSIAADKAAAADADLGAALIESLVKTQLSGWIENPQDAFPVMRLSDEAAAAVDAKRTVALLTAEAAKANAKDLARLTAADLAQLPVLGRKPDAVVAFDDAHVLLARVGPDWYAAEVRAVDSALEVSSFSKLTAAEARRLADRGRLVFGSVENA